MPDQTERRGHQALLTRKLKDTSGAAIALVALSMVALLSAVALAVDVGMMVTARTEAQRLGDAAALTGARILRDTQGDSAQAHDSTAYYGSIDNTVQGETVPILDQDVDVIPDEWTVRVRVKRTRDRGNAIPTFFARIFGVDSVDIRTESAAWAAEGTVAGSDDDSWCPLFPLSLLDEFEDDLDPPGWNGEPVDGYTLPDDHGDLIKIKVKANSSDEVEGEPVDHSIDYCRNSPDDDSWRCWWHAEGESTENEVLVERIQGTSCDNPVAEDDQLLSSPGERQGTPIDAIDDLIKAEPNLAWCDDCNGTWPDDSPRGCVIDTDTQQCFTGQSNRIRSFPVVDPTSITDQGSSKTGTVEKFVGGFIEKLGESYLPLDQQGPRGQWSLYIRIIVTAGTGASGNDDGNGGEAGFNRTLQLIE